MKKSDMIKLQELLNEFYDDYSKDYSVKQCDWINNVRGLIANKKYFQFYYQTKHDVEFRFNK